MVKCPFCGFEGEFRELKGPWKFRFYTVRMLQCPSCNGAFNHYEGVSPKGKYSEYTIKVTRREKREVKEAKPEAASS